VNNTQKILGLLTGLIFIGISFYLSFQFIEINKNFIGRFGVGWTFSTILLRLLICFSFGRGFQLLLKVLLPKFKGVFAFSIGFILGFGVSFISPIYASDYGDLSDQEYSFNTSDFNAVTSDKYSHEKDPFLVCFFTTSCPHCKDACKLLGFMHSVGRMTKVVLIFPGEKENRVKFLEENNGNAFDAYSVEDQFFLSNSGGKFPSIYLVNPDGSINKHWYGGGLNYTALDYLAKIN